MVIILKSLSGRFFIFTLLSSYGVSFCSFIYSILCYHLILSNFLFYFYVFDRLFTFPNLGEVASCRRCHEGLSRCAPLCWPELYALGDFYVSCVGPSILAALLLHGSTGSIGCYTPPCTKATHFWWVEPCPETAGCMVSGVLFSDCRVLEISELALVHCYIGWGTDIPRASASPLVPCTLELVSVHWWVRQGPNPCCGWSRVLWSLAGGSEGPGFGVSPHVHEARPPAVPGASACALVYENDSWGLWMKGSWGPKLMSDHWWMDEIYARGGPSAGTRLLADRMGPDMYRFLFPLVLKLVSSHSHSSRAQESQGCCPPIVGLGQVLKIVLTQ